MFGNGDSPVTPRARILVSRYNRQELRERRKARLMIFLFMAAIAFIELGIITFFLHHK